jgi:hypothetical protein
MRPLSPASPRGPVVHILSQYLWPDDAPTGIYAEQLGDALARGGVAVRLVGGTGLYRAGERMPPATAIERIAHREGRRGHLLSTALEYESVRRAFASEITRSVSPGDVVVVTSAPPTTIGLIRQIHAKAARGVYWLQDFYPELIRGVFDFPLVLRRRFSAAWRARLGDWDHVVKAAGNLGYHGANARVIRNWPTLDLGEPRPFVPGTALYSGNLGWGHHLPSFVALCEKMRREGFAIMAQGDGPGLARLPDWIRVGPALKAPADLIRAYWEAEVHLVAGHPAIPGAVFPSKFWNARATGRKVLFSGLTGEMEEERRAAEAADYRRHLPEFADFLGRIARGDAG